MSNGPMLNAYPDSMGGTLDDIVKVLKKDELKDTFESFYILPSIFNTDLDRGFSVIDYGINEEDFLATLDEMSEQAFDDLCTGANPRYPLIEEIKNLYLKVYYGGEN